MTVKTLRAHELAIPVYIDNRVPRAVTSRIDIIKKVRYLVEETNWDKKILKGEKRVDFFCWLLLGFSGLYFCLVGWRMLIR
jgi:hypothetical protein